MDNLITSNVGTVIVAIISEKRRVAQVATQPACPLGRHQFIGVESLIRETDARPTPRDLRIIHPFRGIHLATICATMKPGVGSVSRLVLFSHLANLRGQTLSVRLLPFLPPARALLFALPLRVTLDLDAETLKVGFCTRWTPLASGATANTHPHPPLLSKSRPSGVDVVQ